jgi:tetratricopeptide (TPR) repeat protein
LFLLSHQSDPPYYDRSLIDKAYETWHSSPDKVVTNSADAWYYIVIARLHEVKYKFTERNFEEEYWQAVLYVERSLVHDDKNFSFWNYLGRYYRNIAMVHNSMLAFSIAESFNNTDEYLLEEKIMLLIDMGDFEKPLAYVAGLKSEDGMQNERPAKTISYQSYHIYWEGFVKFHQGAFVEAIQLFNSLIEKDNNNLNGRHMRMLSNWYLANFEEARTGAREVLELGRKYTYSREEIIFGWATFINGDTAGAIAIVEDYAKKIRSGSDHLSALCIFHLYAGKLDKAKAVFDQFMQWTNNKLTIIQLLFGLGTIKKIIREEKAQVYSDPMGLTDQVTQWDLLLNQRLSQLAHDGGGAEDELMYKQKECSFEPGSRHL